VHLPFGLFQVGGRHSFDFLNVPNHAQLGALGCKSSLADRDLNFFYSNPSLVTPCRMGRRKQLYIADVVKPHNSMPIGLTGSEQWRLAFSIGYGNIKSYDVNGQGSGDIRVEARVWLTEIIGGEFSLA